MESKAGFFSWVKDGGKASHALIPQSLGATWPSVAETTLQGLPLETRVILRPY